MLIAELTAASIRCCLYRIRIATERKVDLIVISSHGRAGLGRILFGSTAEAVVRHALCPVLVVKPQQEGAGRSEQ